MIKYRSDLELCFIFLNTIASSLFLCIFCCCYFRKYGRREQQSQQLWQREQQRRRECIWFTSSDSIRTCDQLLKPNMISHFKRLNPPTFNGASDQAIVEMWIPEMKKKLSLLMDLLSRFILRSSSACRIYLICIGLQMIQISEFLSIYDLVGRIYTWAHHTRILHV